jgi:predicted transcriptional regulator
MNKHVIHGHVVDPDTESRLQRVAARMNLSAAELVNMAVDYFLDQVETPEEELLGHEDTMREYERTGLHVTNDEMMEWLERTANGEDVPMPKPHT